MGAEDIKKQYENAYNSQVTELERQRQKAFEEATNRENQTKLEYEELAKQYANNKTDATNKYKGLQTGLDTQQADAKNRYYDDRNQASVQNAKSTQQTRDYMAKNNLLQSGESVDAMLRGNTDLSNNLGAIRSSEDKTNLAIGNQRNAYNQEEQSYYQKIDGMIGASEREKTQKLNELLAYRNSATEDYNAKKNSYFQQMEANKIKDINDYNEQLRREQVARDNELKQQQFQREMAAQQQAARSSSSGGGSAKEPSISERKNQLTSEFMQMTKSKDNLKAKKFLDAEKYNIISEYGDSFYKSLEKAYWDDMGDYYKPKSTKGQMIN